MLDAFGPPKTLSHRTVVVTGLGVVCALGVGVQRVWQKLQEGGSGAQHLQQQDLPEVSPDALMAFSLGMYGSRRTDTYTQDSHMHARPITRLSYGYRDVEAVAFPAFSVLSMQAQRPAHHAFARTAVGRVDTEELRAGLSDFPHPLQDRRTAPFVTLAQLAAAQALQACPGSGWVGPCSKIL